MLSTLNMEAIAEEETGCCEYGAGVLCAIFNIFSVVSFLSFHVPSSLYNFFVSFSLNKIMYTYSLRELRRENQVSWFTRIY